MDEEQKDEMLFNIRKLRGSGTLPEIAAYLYDYKVELVKAGFSEGKAMQITVGFANTQTGGSS